MACTRKQKHSRRQTVARRRAADLQKRHRKRFERRRRQGAEVKRRRRIVRNYRGRRRAGCSEAQAAAGTAQKFACSVATVRRYARAYAKGRLPALKPAVPGPSTSSSQIPPACQMLIVTIRTLGGWCGQRIAAEVERRGMYQVSHTPVYNLLHRYHLKVRTYHPKAVRNGIAYTRFERKRPNELWHVDFKGPIKLGAWTLYLFVIQEDHSRYVLDVHVSFDCTADTAIARVQRAFQLYGVPRQLMSDNGRAFPSVWEQVEHRFDQALRPYGVEHLLIPPYYPEANGKVEAFIKTLSNEALALLVAQVQTPEDLQEALEGYVRYYKNYRAHSALDYQPPVKRYLGWAPRVEGLAEIWGLPELDCPEWPGWAEPPPSPIKTIILAA